ncbi:hypothetical protein MKW98_010772 [Papaver atlanticum]|uniref:Uncharacterized protein n=1 Tax=Papaver atlanticum TaxID=357466 RepID=A0AAD4XHS9_9MAGN|nr:hypothetical protein MKW98_010772 [Papaver atlanticum]
MAVEEGSLSMRERHGERVTENAKPSLQILQLPREVDPLDSCTRKAQLIISTGQFSTFSLSNFVRAQRILWYRNTLHARIVQLRLKFLTFSLN